MIERTCEFCKHMEKGENEYPCVRCIHNAVDRFERQTNGWIPCSERLPEEGESVLISTKTSDRVYVGLYTKRYWFEVREGFICADGFMWLNTATAWMPLPEPYKESED